MGFVKVRYNYVGYNFIEMEMEFEIYVIGVVRNQEVDVGWRGRV